MMHTNPACRDVDLTGGSIRALCSLRRALSASSRERSVQTFNDYDGFLSIIVEPTNDLGHSSYLIAGTAKQVDLAEMRDECLHTLDRFETVSIAADRRLVDLINTLPSKQRAGRRQNVLAHRDGTRPINVDGNHRRACSGPHPVG